VILLRAWYKYNNDDTAGLFQRTALSFSTLFSRTSDFRRLPA